MTARPSPQKAFRATLERAAREPLDTDISDYADEWCAGFLTGQVNALEYIETEVERLREALTFVLELNDALPERSVDWKATARLMRDRARRVLERSE